MFELLTISVSPVLATTAVDFNINNTDVEHLKVIQFDTKGHLYQSLQTEQLQHAAQKNEQIFINPVMIVTKQQQPWKIKAQKMQRRADQQTIVLQHHVLIQEVNRSLADKRIFRTEELFYSPQQEIGHTHQQVTLQQGLGHIIIAQGMHIDAHRQQIKFLSQVRGEYKPK